MIFLIQFISGFCILYFFIIYFKFFSRLVEVVCGLKPYSLGSLLRDPSGDRLRKLGNVKKVIEAAKLEGLDLGSHFYNRFSAFSFFVVDHFEIFWCIFDFAKFC